MEYDHDEDDEYEGEYEEDHDDVDEDNYEPEDEEEYPVGDIPPSQENGEDPLIYEKDGLIFPRDTVF